MVLLCDYKAASLQTARLSKRGFTLLETMLAVGLLVMLTLIIYLGFVSTMQIATNTALFEKAGDLSTGKINVSLQNAAAAPSIAPVQGLYMDNSGVFSFERVVGVTTYSASTAVDTSYGDPAYAESSVASTNRSGFTFQAPLCPNDHTELKWYMRTDGSGTYSVFCPKGDYIVP